MSVQINSFDLAPILIQTGYGIPDHVSPLGSEYTDLYTAFKYYNTDGIAHWVQYLDTSFSGGFIPYTGATTNVDLGIYGLKANYLSLNTATTVTSNIAEIVWNDTDGTFDMGLYNGVTLQVGQEENMYGKAISGISNGDVVMFAGTQGSHVLFAKADQNVINVRQEYIIGIATQNFAINQFGYVTTIGKVRDLNTLAYSAGTILYFDSTGTTAGALTSSEPPAPYANVMMAAVLRSHGTQGVLLVRPTFRFPFKSLDDVQITNIQNNDIVQYSSSLGYFVNTNTPSFTSVSATTIIVDTTTVGHSFFTKVQSAFNASFGTQITMDNLKVRINGSGGSAGLIQAGSVSGSFTAYTTLVGNVAGFALQGDTNSGITFTTTYTNISGSQLTLNAVGDITTLHLIDTTNSRIYRITAIHCQGTTGGYTSIERMS